MATDIVPPALPPAEAPQAGVPVVGKRPWIRILAGAAHTRRGLTGLCLMAPVILLAFAGPFLTPHPPDGLASVPFSPPSSAYPLGTDVLGRDVLSRLMDGGWRLLMMSSAATAIGVIAGAVIGVCAAYFGRSADAVLMRGVDLVLAFPQLVFGLLLVSVVGPKIWLIILAVGISHVPQVARVIRSASLDIVERDFVKAAQLLRVPSRRMITTEIMPNLITPLMVEIGLRLTFSIILMAGLSFIGLGVQPPASDWGVMINENRLGLTASPWSVIVPAFIILLLTVGTNTFTDAVSRVATGIARRRPRRSGPGEPGEPGGPQGDGVR
jgi:peptide/nickel transport system permease protein